MHGRFSRDNVSLFQSGFDPLGIGAKADEYLANRLESGGITACLAYQYGPKGDGFGGAPVDDPATILVDLGLGEYEEEHCTFTISLEALVDEALAWNEERLPAMAARLRQLADKLEGK